MTELELIVDFHKDAKRQGPGSEHETLMALGAMGLDTSDKLRIADIGCGSGAQTITLAQNTNSHITAVDLFPVFLEKLESRAQKLGLTDKISTLKASMDALPFDDNSFDIIWSEGAIYNMGYENGLTNWNKFLKPGGYIAVSELSWITDTRPMEIEDYWLEGYPDIDTIENKVNLLEKSGYSVVDYFVLPPHCWLENYYDPMEKRFDSFLENHNNVDLAQQFIEAERNEISNYKKYKEYFSYGFYIARKN